MSDELQGWTTHSIKGASQRRAAAKQASQQRRSHQVIVTVLALLLCIASLGTIVKGTFTVRTVRVVPATLPQADIQQASGVMGANIFTVRSDQVIDRLSQVPSIDVQRVETNFPDQLTVYATLRHPVAAWKSAGGVFLLDRSGRNLGPSPQTTLPAITGGNRVPGAGMVAAVLYATAQLQLVAYGAVSSLMVDPRYGLVIVGREGWRARVGHGSPQLMVRRVVTLIAYLKQISSRVPQLDFVDLRYPEPFSVWRHS